MAGFYRYETKTFPIEIVGGDGLSGYRKVVVSISQPIYGTKLDLHSDKGEIEIVAEENLINVTLSQEQTAKFVEGDALIQVNILYDNSERDVTAEAVLTVYRNEYEKVMA